MKFVLLKLLALSFIVSAPLSYSAEYTPNERWFYAGFHLGKSNLSTNESDEAGDKEGIQYGLMASGLLDYDKFQVNLGATYYFLNFQSDRVNDVKYNLETQTLALEASPLWKLDEHFSVGPKLQLILTEKMLVGPSDKKNESNDSLTTNKLIGANAFFTHKYKKFDLRFGAHIHKPFEIGDRDITILLLSVELGQIIKP
ncbi:MAG: autotransporter domain-containing protein [Halobacteriovoraceae bacterium]|jgi:hypothetical protein|nr:autotransporter domain-containing protein [Halobacteriovoraceae bacterium]